MSLTLQYFLGGDLLGLFEPVLDGRKPIAVNQPIGGGTDYPFVLASDINHIVADAYLYSVGGEASFTRPFSIKWLYGFGSTSVYPPIIPTHPQDALIVDAEGQTVFDSTEADEFSSEIWADRLRVIEWHNTTTGRILRIVQHIAVAEDATPENFPRYYEPQNGTLDDRVVEFVYPNLRSLAAEDSDPVTGAVTLEAGYNMELVTTRGEVDESGRTPTIITFNAVPGAGRGKFTPECEEDPLLRTINGVRGDANGNFKLDATSCYRIERPIIALIDEAAAGVSVFDHALQILNDCLPCCTCDDFINTYEGIRRLRDRYALLWERAKEARDIFAENIARWESQRECRLAQVLRVAVQPSCDGDVQLAVSLCNNSDQCLDNLVIFISLQYADGAGDIDPVTAEPYEANTVYNGGASDPTVVCGTTMRAGNFEANPQQTFSRNQPVPYPIAGTYPHFYAVWDRVSPATTASFLFNLDTPDSEAGDQIEVVVDAYAIPAGVSVPVGSDLPPVPGYEFGAGPLTEEARSYRIGTIRKISSGLLQTNCCEEDEEES